MAKELNYEAVQVKHIGKVAMNVRRTPSGVNELMKPGATLEFERVTAEQLITSYPDHFEKVSASVLKKAGQELEGGVSEAPKKRGRPKKNP